jgi:hypothetical protein
LSRAAFWTREDATGAAKVSRAKIDVTWPEAWEHAESPQRGAAS